MSGILVLSGTTMNPAGGTSPVAVGPPGRNSSLLAALHAVVLAAWLAAGLYAGAACWFAGKALEVTGDSGSSGEAASYDYHGLNFLDRQSLLEFVSRSSAGQWFPWVFSIPNELIPLCSAVVFGALGGAVRLLKQLALDHAPVGSLAVVSAPMFGALIGTMVCFLGLTPAFAMSREIDARPESVAGFSLLGGAFSEVAYAWIEVQARRLFGSKRKGDDVNVASKE
jgi:hypothetical protein